MILLLKTADGVDAGYSGHGLELQTNDPILHSAKVSRALEIGRETLALRSEIAPIALPAGFGIHNSYTLAGPLIIDRPHVNLA